MRVLSLRLSVAAGAALALAGCATTLPPSGPVSVTRFHLPEAAPVGDVALVPASGADPQSIEYRTYLAPVAAEMGRIGYRVVPSAAGASYVAEVGVSRNSRIAPPRRSPVTIGIGGGFGGGGWNSGGGVGGGVAFPVGGNRAGPELVGTQLSVRIRRQADKMVVWEGRAFGEARADGPGADPAASAPRLAGALFQGFPGESGRTITVK